MTVLAELAALTLHDGEPPRVKLEAEILYPRHPDEGASRSCDAGCGTALEAFSPCLLVLEPTGPGESSGILRATLCWGCGGALQVHRARLCAERASRAGQSH